MAATVVSQTIWSASTTIEVKGQAFEYEAQLRLAFKCVVEAAMLFKAVANDIDRARFSVSESKAAKELYEAVRQECLGALDV